MNEILIGLAVGAVEGIVESFIPEAGKLIEKGNKNLKGEAPIGYMAGELSRGLTKAAMVFLFL